MKHVLILLLASAGARAQVASATLSGTVQDQLDALIPRTAITVTAAATGAVYSTITDDQGFYTFPSLPPGAYRLRAEKPGFQPFQVDGVTLQVSQRGRYDVRLTVASPSTGDVTVTASVSPVDSESSTVGYRMDSAKIRQLPLASRNVVALVTLGPGAIPRQLGGFGHDVNNDMQEGTRGSVALNPPVNGARSTQNTFLLDGAYDTNRNTFAIAVYPPIESVQELRIQSSLAPAEFPQSGGGAIDVVTRSGSRTLHGSVFEYLRNEFADSRNYFDDPALPRPIFRQNQFGASLGGPVPRAGRTFFYGVYDGIRQKAGASGLAIVPDAATRAGAFTGSAIYDPLTAVPRTPFPGNRIPQTRIDSVATSYLTRYEPLPNSFGGTSNYRDATPNEATTNTASGRVDHQFARGMLTARYTLNSETNRVAGSFPVLPTSEQVRAQQATLAYVANTATSVLELRAGFTRLRMFDVPESAFQVNVAQELGLADPPTDPVSFGLPFFNVTNYSLVTDSPSAPQTQRDNLWHGSAKYARAAGRHTWKIGGDLLAYRMNYLRSNLSRGQYNYTGGFTSADGSGVGSGDPFADFLLGYPQQTTRTRGSAQAYLRQTVPAVYAQDEWRISPGLTLNFGLRYEYASPFTEKRGNLLNLDYSTLPQAPRLTPVETGAAPDRNNFAPRVGLAWQFAPRTVFRAGYGVYFSPEIAIESYDLILNGLRNENNETQSDRAPVLTTRDGFARTASTGLPSYFGLDPRARTPYVQQWNASLQRELPGRTLLELAYIGSKGTKLGRYRQFNTPAHVETGENLPPRPGELQALRAFAELGKLIQRQHIANSSYQSLQAKLERSLSSRLSVLASFVWSKSIDDADSVIPGLFESAGAQDERNLRLERALSFDNPGRRVTAAYVWRLPDARFAGPVLRRWTLSGAVTLQDGTPVNPFYFSLDFANSGTHNRPDVVPGVSVNLPRGQRTADHFFNTDAFAAPARYTFGNAGRDTIPGPGNNVFDFALQREFRVREGHTVRFRAEAFNAFNHPNWGIPGPYPDFGPFFGKIFTSGEPRRMQFALRYDF
jgi:outer membrane receptor protein involved in Fe transport